MRAALAARSGASRAFASSSGKTILITGAGTGLGAGSALGLAAAGHRVIAACHIHPQISTLMAEARGRAVQLETAKLDVTLASDREAVFNRFGESVDIVVCNAAVGEGGPLAELPTERLRSQFEVNVFSQLDFVQPYAAAMVAKGAGKIVFLSSIAGLFTVPYLGAYCMSKHAVEAMALTLRQELASSGVKVCTINPAPFTTGFNDRNVETHAEWFDPAVHFTPKAAIQDFQTAMANGMQVDEMVRLIPLDNHRAREMHTPNWEVICKQYQARAVSRSPQPPPAAACWASDLDGNLPDDFWGASKTEDGTPMPPLDTSEPPTMAAADVRPLGL
ncbi:hypothetical protein EMIHUDRAFT_102403 [Emiliania huxleyi CCMP1516]|uniref:Uncharacterized protein n=2 Tax=Emiliania huxleyi TaxID=2903 RepID=A0A0D3J5Z7_EMIH1|nr:hypothetical protein EMIHUDRAFT_102403 [Emiliania huxleyi CCMP1516]EOD18932.1 hypothetical protein EMIHUDRAFT_102403 [Emiliania huxleyi CCMP1516]|eukprot:XP_005771361.1 hypothetical protein EMIHUDRAFT_102403 [Emiliania huxleyi CCMP1516]